MHKLNSLVLQTNNTHSSLYLSLYHCHNDNLKQVGKCISYLVLSHYSHRPSMSTDKNFSILPTAL